jgi:hypothetical protein
MTTLITVRNSNAPGGRSVKVISERLHDRQRFPNGEDEVLPGAERSFVIDDEQSVRVVEVEAAVTDQPETAPEA